MNCLQVLTNPLLAEALAAQKASNLNLLLNPAKTLLAISLPSALVLVILPRSSSVSSTIHPTISVKAHKVGSFYHNDHAPRAEHIVSTKWHPWSKRATSLMVLLRNGTLFEYDVARDTREPQQMISLLPTSRRASSPRIGMGARGRRSVFADEDDDNEAGDEEASAVSFTLAIGETYAADWLPLTIYVLTKSGDVYAAAPFLPRFARVPSSYLHSLSHFVQASANHTHHRKQDEYALRFVSNLLKQAKNFSDEQATGGTFDDPSDPGRQFRATTPADLIGRHRQRSRSVVSMSLDPQEDTEADGVSEDPEIEFVEVKAPNLPLVPGPALSQGPFLLAPAPHELNETREGQGSDIAHVRLPAASDGQSSFDVLLLTSDDGRVDVALLDVSGKVLPRWSSQESAHSSTSSLVASLDSSQRRSLHKSGRYGLDDSSDEDDSDDDGQQDAGHLPTLFLYETLDLGLATPSLRPVPRIVTDPVYADTVYIHHAFGAHMVSLAPWAERFASLLHEAGSDELVRFLHTSTASQTKWIVRIQDTPAQTSEEVGREGVSKLQVVDDIYLGYSLLVLLGDGECFGVEMSMRTPWKVSANASESDSLADGDAANGERKYYTSLLGSDAFVPPSVFTDSGAAFPSTRLKSTSDKGGKEEIRVTPESLRTLGTTVQELRGKMREVVQGGNAMQRRLELQIKESQRQLGKLNDTRDRIASHRKEGGGSGGTASRDNLSERINQVRTRQRGLITRVDRVLQRSMDAAESGGPGGMGGGSISKYEEAWLKEMSQLETELGMSRSGTGLEARVEKLRGQLEEMRPDMHLVVEEEVKRSRQHQNLGSRQLEKVLAVLSQEADRLVDAKEKVQLLNRSIAKAGGVSRY